MDADECYGMSDLRKKGATGLCRISQPLMLEVRGQIIMTIMKTVSVTEFKAHCLELVSEVSRTGEAVVLTKHGKPTAMVVPPPTDEKKKWRPGLFRGTTKIVGDIIAPLDEPWEALL